MRFSCRCSHIFCDQNAVGKSSAPCRRCTFQPTARDGRSFDCPRRRACLLSFFRRAGLNWLVTRHGFFTSCRARAVLAKLFRAVILFIYRINFLIKNFSIATHGIPGACHARPSRRPFRPGGQFSRRMAGGRCHDVLRHVSLALVCGHDFSLAGGFGEPAYQRSPSDASDASRPNLAFFV